MTPRIWKVAGADRERALHLVEKFDMDPFVAYILVERGLTDDVQVSEFLSDDVRLMNPFLLSGMEAAVQLIEQAADNGEKICIYGDFDCDGVTATALLYSYLDTIGADVFFYIPQREGEGYGMHADAIERIAERGAKLLITVDNGIACVEEVAVAKSLGMQVIITDHHQIPPQLPQADAVIDPHLQNDLEFTDFSGAGVAFKLVCALHGSADEILEAYGDLAAIGTIGDIVPLLGENRALVKAGLQMLNRSPRPGVQALRSVIGDQARSYSAGDVAFRIVPRINAAGRLGSADAAVKLLISEDYAEALEMAAILDQENARRRALDTQITQEIEELLVREPARLRRRVLVFSGASYHPGVIGIAAAHICERYAKPCIVFAVGENGEAHGSCRSVEGFNIYEALSACASLLTQFGGHPMAAGLSLPSDRIDAFAQAINAYADSLDAMPVPVLHIDCKLAVQYANLALAQSLETLQPFGAGNEEAVFGLYNFEITGLRPLGENGQHVRIEAVKKGVRMQAALFGVPADRFAYVVGDKIDLAVKISVNLYKGRQYVSLRAADVRLHSADTARYFEEKDVYERAERGLVPGDLTPPRDAFVLVYSFLKKHPALHLRADDLYFRLQGKISYTDLMYCISAFCDCKLIRMEPYICLLSHSGKADLMATPTVQALKRRASHDKIRTADV